MADKTIPHDINAEEAVLGSILMDESQMNYITIQSQDFFSKRNSLVFEACKQLSDKRVGINQITVAHELSSMGYLESCGGAAYISSLITAVPTSLDCPYYAKIVKKLSLKRKLINLGEKIANQGYKLDGEIEDDLSNIDVLFNDMRKETQTDEIITPEARVDQAFDYYLKLQTKSGGAAVSTGLTDLDKWLGGGAYPGELVLIGGRGGMGKTTLAKTIANNIGDHGGRVLYFTCEMKTQSLTDRDVAGYLGETIDTIRYGDYNSINTGLFDRISGALEYLKTSQVYHVDGLINTERVRRVSLQMKQRYGLDAIFVDYLGLLTDSYGKTDYQRISYISRMLKQIAIEMDVPLFAPVQLNREADKREQKRPVLSDLRDSGSLEQDADVVLLLYRDSYYQRETTDNTTEVIIAKKRQGRSNIIVQVYFDEKHQRCCNLQRSYANEY